MMHWGNFNGMGFGGMGFGWIFMILFWVVVILGIVYIVKYIGSSNKVEGQKETALDILKKRYAKGEISKEVFDEMKKDLG